MLRDYYAVESSDPRAAVGVLTSYRGRHRARRAWASA